jgi:rhodanese-related sulfurtransferase
MTKKCLDCKSSVIDDLESDMENEVPMWYKKAGNYSLLPKLLNCEDKFNPNKTELKRKTPEITEIEVKVDIKIKKNTWVFYWASLSNKEFEINGPEAAYGDGSNSGLVKTDKKGETKLIMNCPQPYRVDGITYPRHVHYTTLTEDNVWSFDIKTIVVYCHLDKGQMKKAIDSKDHIVINALSEESFDERSIPDTMNLPVGELNANNRDEKVKSFIDRVLKNYPELEDLIEKDKIDSKDIPIITYCANKGCNASKELAKHIMDAGYSNVVEYPGGIEEWFNEKKKEGDKEHTDEEEESFFEDTNKYNLDIEYETIIINGVKYKHKLDELNDVFDENDNKVGELIDNEIKWSTEQDKENNEFMIDTDDESDDDDTDDESDDDTDDEKTKTMMDLINGKKVEEEEEQAEQSDEETSEEEEQAEEEEQDEETSEEEEEEEASDKKDKKDKKDGGGDKRSNALAYDGIYLCHGGGDIVTQKQYDTLFRGWGFTFL